MHNLLLYICIGMINGLIFGTLIVVIIHYGVLFEQANQMILSFVKPLDIFKDFVIFNFVNKNQLKQALSEVVNNNINTPEQIAQLEGESEEYLKRFNTFMIVTGVLAFLGIIILSIIILRNNKIKYIMGDKVGRTIKINNPKALLLEWFLEILVTLLLLIFIYIYFRYIIVKYIYGNVMKIFVPK